MGKLVLGVRRVVAASQSAYYPSGAWETVTPSSVGVDSSAADAFASAIGGSGAIMRRGQIPKTWGSGLSLDVGWASASKPLIQSMAQVAVQNAVVANLDVTLASFMLDRSFNAKDDGITLNHCGHMTGGWARSEDPGVAFAYNDRQILLRNLAVFDYLYAGEDSGTDKFITALPLNWQDTPSLGEDEETGDILAMTIGDMLRFGWMCANYGNWDGTQVINASYFTSLLANPVPTDIDISSGTSSPSFDEGASSADTSNATGNSYGAGNYAQNFWVNTNGLWTDLDSDVFSCDGHFGAETCIIFPTQEMVVAWKKPTNEPVTFSAQNTALAALVAGLS